MTNFPVMENIWKIRESVKCPGKSCCCPGKVFFKKLFDFYLGENREVFTGQKQLPLVPESTIFWNAEF